MTKVDFYILKSSNEEARLHFTCRLLEKILRQGHRVLLACANKKQSKAFDDLLWTFKPESFLPHERAVDQQNTTAGDFPITINTDNDVTDHHDVLVNLRDEIPPYFARFKRLAQIVNQEPEILAASRRHFTFFRDHGYPVDVSKLNQ